MGHDDPNAADGRKGLVVGAVIVGIGLICLISTFVESWLAHQPGLSQWWLVVDVLVTLTAYFVYARCLVRFVQRRDRVDEEKEAKRRRLAEEMRRARALWMEGK